MLTKTYLINSMVFLRHGLIPILIIIALADLLQKSQLILKDAKRKSTENIQRPMRNLKKYQKNKT